MPNGLNKLAAQIAKWREEKGFYTPSTLHDTFQRDAMLGKLMLVVTEVAEAAEEVRKIGSGGRIVGPSDLISFYEEIADTFIRLLDICGTMGIDIEGAIEKKMEANALRPVRHGKSTTL